ncbi:MAG: hypothetical protein II261_10180, partial [Bacteroidaceae bacterium]|nr:hypothetical protein [Bacteroidaceae bacterium]
YNYSSIPKIIPNFAFDKAGPAGRAGQKTLLEYASAAIIEVVNLAVARSMKGRFQTLSSVVKLRNFEHAQEGIATKRSRWVYYTRMYASPKHLQHTLYIIPNGVGWLSCLSMCIGNAKA